MVGGVLEQEEEDLNINTWDEEAEHIKVAQVSCEFAFLAREVVAQLVSLDENTFANIRVGINCGPVVTGLSGTTTPHFSVVGETVSLARRLECNSRPSTVHASAAFVDLLEHPYAQPHKFAISRRPASPAGAAAESLGLGLGLGLGAAAESLAEATTATMNAAADAESAASKLMRHTDASIGFFVEMLSTSVDEHYGHLNKILCLMRDVASQGDYVYSTNGKVVRAGDGGGRKFEFFYVPLDKSTVDVALDDTEGSAYDDTVKWLAL